MDLQNKQEILPTYNELIALNVELSLLILIYFLTIFFALHNILMYLWKQKRYKICLLAFFYMFSLIVLVT